MKKPLIVGASGASGMPLLLKCLELLKENENYETHLIVTESARLTYEYEVGPIQTAEALADVVYQPQDIGKGPASGSFVSAGMLIVPCSMKTVAGIHSGYADNLLLRAADVTIKEQRKLVLAARETPLSSIHLRNLTELSQIPGVRIIPPMMSFYHKPECIDDMILHMAAKLLEPFDIQVEGYKRWTN